MSIKGFNVNGVTEQYDYNYLDNKPEIHSIPTGGTAGQVLAKRSGADYAVEWADQTGGGGDITVDDVLSNTSENPVQNKVITAALATKADQAGIQQVIEDEVDDWLTAQAPSIGTLSYAAKQALLACFRKVAWIDNQGQSYYSTLERELFPDSVLESITAVFTQGSATIYDTDSLDTLKQYLTVTATYSDSTTATVTDYTLSGTLTEGTSTITVAYGGKTDTFNVTVTHIISGWFYTFNETILSSGTNDFGLSGVQNYANGVESGEKCYYHHVETEGNTSTDPLGLYSLASVDYPIWSNNDFTVSLWMKGNVNKRGHMFTASKRYASSSHISWTSNITSVASGWSVTKADANKTYAGIRLGMVSEQLYISLTNAAVNNGSVYRITPPSDFDTTQWHHYALTRSADILYYFVDGNIIFNATLPSSVQLYSSDVITIGNFVSESSATPAVAPALYSSYHQDLYVTVGHAKWTTNFDPLAITY